jgi:putative membrane protein
MAEIELGRHAQQNATNQRVKNFGAMMVKDHTRASEELKKVVSGKNMQVPSEIEDKHRRMIDDLKKKTGIEFDKEYMKAMVDDHENDVKFFRKQSEDGKDPDIKAFAGKNVPVLQMHLDSAKAIRDAVNR